MRRILNLPGRRNLFPLAVAGVLMLTGFLGALAQSEQDIMNAAEVAYNAAESDAERLAVVRNFLANHPDHPEVGMVVEVGIQLLDGKMADQAGAIALVENQLPLIQDPETRRRVQGMLMVLYSNPQNVAKLKVLVADRYDSQTMSFVDHLTVIKAGTGAQEWSLVDTHCEAARPLATPEAYRQAYPEQGFTDDFLQAAGDNRQGLLKTYQGWAAANRGDLETAGSEFGEARKLLRHNYFGLPDNELPRFQGEALVMDGMLDEGLEMLVMAGIYNHDEEAMTAARTVFVDMGKPADEFEAYLWQIRQKNGPQMTDFTAVDYQDASHAFTGLRGRKATLLAFWFPT